MNRWRFPEGGIAETTQAATIASALDAALMSEPDHYFRDVGDILATPELTTTSPWLNPAQSGITDEAYEKIPAQLLPMLRRDSVGSITKTGGSSLLRFSGVDGYAYGVQVSSNLIDWTPVATNYPINGYFNYSDASGPAFSIRFYRSVLLP